MHVPAEFTAFVRACRPTLLRTAYLLAGDRHRAEDLVQETLLRVARRWERCAEAPLGYARVTLHRVAIDQHRWRSRRPESPPAQVTGSVQVDVTGGVDTKVVLARALARLTPAQRAVLVARFYDDLTEVQAARALGVSPNTVKSQTRRALQRLRELAPELLADVADPLGGGR
ncbi:MAG: SigE family RNA polymerase sigma factor [Tetrasphaera sp.]